MHARTRDLKSKQKLQEVKSEDTTSGETTTTQLLKSLV